MMTTSSLACCIVTWDHHQQKELTPLSPLQRKCGMRVRPSESRERASTERHRSSHKMQRRSAAEVF